MGRVGARRGVELRGRGAANVHFVDTIRMPPMPGVEVSVKTAV